MTPMNVEIWSDIACPWCWVGKKNLELALADFDHEVRIEWRAFELNPQAPATPAQPVDYAERLATKYGMPRRDAQAFIDRMTEAGRGVGVDFRFDRIRPCNTFRAHRLLAWAKTLGRQNVLKERLFLAYMTRGSDLNDLGTLGELAVEAGLDAEEATGVLVTEAFTDEVRSDQARARKLGITGVPFFVFGPGLVASGAQPPAMLRGALGQALLLREPEPSSSPATVASAVCGPDGCE